MNRPATYGPRSRPLNLVFPKEVVDEHYSGEPFMRGEDLAMQGFDEGTRIGLEARRESREVRDRHHQSEHVLSSTTNLTDLAFDRICDAPHRVDGVTLLRVDDEPSEVGDLGLCPARDVRDCALLAESRRHDPRRRLAEAECQFLYLARGDAARVDYFDLKTVQCFRVPRARLGQLADEVPRFLFDPLAQRRIERRQVSRYVDSDDHATPGGSRSLQDPSDALVKQVVVVNVPFGRRFVAFGEVTAPAVPEEDVRLPATISLRLELDALRACKDESMRERSCIRAVENCSGTRRSRMTSSKPGSLAHERRYTATSMSCITDARWGEAMRCATGCFFGSSVIG